MATPWRDTILAMWVSFSVSMTLGQDGAKRECDLVGLGGQAQIEPPWLDLERASRHGLIAGATGTSKTITM
jgi:hypothetical protein